MTAAGGDGGRRNRVVRSDTPRMIIRLAVNNQIPGERSYAGWREDATAKLEDSQGRAYAVAELSEWQAVAGVAETNVLPAGEVIDDIVVFTTDAEMDVDQLQWLRLRISAAAYGGEGDYWFEIPTSMIEGPGLVVPPPNWTEGETPPENQDSPEIP